MKQTAKNWNGLNW